MTEHQREHQREQSFPTPGMPPPTERGEEERGSRRESTEPKKGPGGAGRGSGGRGAQLFSEQDAGHLRTRWDSIQTRFVDEPRSAVEQADQLVAQVVERVTDTFARERKGLEEQWNRGDDASTEDLRIAMQRYHTFFDRLLEM